MPSFVSAEIDGMRCLINTDQITRFFSPDGQPAGAQTCRALFSDGSTAEILTPFTELEDIVKATHIARRAEASKILLAHGADLPRHKK